MQWASLCRFRLSQNEIKQFRDAIAQHYVFEMFVDELGVKGFVGEMERSSARFERHVHNETHFYLFTHLDFSVAYNGAHVIAVNLTTDPQQRLELEFGKDVRKHNIVTHALSSPSSPSTLALLSLPMLEIFGCTRLPVVCVAQLTAVRRVEETQ